MGRNDHKHGKHHKAAVVAAMEEQGLTADAIVTLAAAGQLKASNGHNLLPPFEIAASTVRNYVQFARRRQRRAAGNGGHDHDDGPVPNEQITVPKPADPWETNPVLRSLLEKARAYDRAIGEGERCECARPTPSPYDVAWRPEGELVQCTSCNRPTPNRKDTYNASRPQSPGQGAVGATACSGPGATA